MRPPSHAQDPLVITPDARRRSCPSPPFVPAAPRSSSCPPEACSSSGAHGCTAARPAARSCGRPSTTIRPRPSTPSVRPSRLRRRPVGHDHPHHGLRQAPRGERRPDRAEARRVPDLLGSPGFRRSGARRDSRRAAPTGVPSRRLRRPVHRRDPRDGLPGLPRPAAPPGARHPRRRRPGGGSGAGDLRPRLAGLPVLRPRRLADARLADRDPAEPRARPRARPRATPAAWRGPFPTKRSSSPLAPTGSTCCCCGQACATRWPACPTTTARRWSRPSCSTDPTGTSPPSSAYRWAPSGAGPITPFVGCGGSWKPKERPSSDPVRAWSRRSGIQTDDLPLTWSRLDGDSAVDQRICSIAGWRSCIACR